MSSKVVTRAGEARRRTGQWVGDHDRQAIESQSVYVQNGGLRAVLIASSLMLAAVAPYIPFLLLPLISDDYIQIMLGRQYGPIDGWADLAKDVLYRSRATSILMTHWLDALFSYDPFAHRSANVLIHAFNVLLIAACGGWNRIGWPISIAAAAAFALMELHQEAVIWSAALPELLVFTFGLSSVMAWAKWMTSRRWYWGAAALVFFALALLSKESGVVVVPLAGMLWLLEARRWKTPFAVLVGMSLISVVYAIGIFAAEDHLHLNDGTFSLHAPFWKTLAITTSRILWPWGVLSLAMLFMSGMRRYAVLLAIAAVWIVVTLLPYSFLTYMERVPSRHTYWASLGLAVLIACAWSAISDWRLSAARTWTMGAALFCFVAGNIGYLWTKKFDQYQRRAEPTEHFLRFAAEAHTPVRISCAPYALEAYTRAAQIRLGKPSDFVSGSDDQSDDRRNYCDTSKP